MDNRLFFVSKGIAVEMGEQSYESEDRLQKIVEDNPHLLARAWSENQCRLFLVQREYEIAESESSANAYWLDHLFIAEDAVPVLVEVKRSSDTRIRREVVGQMLDYACRAATWNAEELRSLFTESNSEDALGELDTDEFWDQVATNLKAEHLRLVFVADQIPDTLRVLIEFLDRRMEGVEVYGVEVKQYSASDALLLTSNVVGNSLLSHRDTLRVSRTWDEGSFSEGLRERGLESLIPVAMDIKSYAASIGMTCAYSRGRCPGFTARIGDQYIFTISAWSKKSIGDLCTAEFGVRHLLSILGEDWTEERIRYLLSNLPGKSDAYGRGLIWDTPQYLYMDLRALLSEEDMAGFRDGIKTLYDAIVHNEHRKLPSPPDFSTFVQIDRRASYANSGSRRGAIPSAAPPASPGRRLTRHC